MGKHCSFTAIFGGFKSEMQTHYKLGAGLVCGEGEIIEISHRAVIPMEFQKFPNNSKNFNGILCRFSRNFKIDRAVIPTIISPSVCGFLKFFTYPRFLVMGEDINNNIILGYFDSKFKYLLPFLIFSPIMRNRGLEFGFRFWVFKN
jgi:hypothetical protein